MKENILEIMKAFIVLFAVIDIPGSIPVILDIKRKSGGIEPLKATLVAFAIMIAFLLAGKSLLGLFGVDISSFAIAGSFVLFLLAFEMISGHQVFKDNAEGGASIVPIAFPLIAGAGTITTIVSLRAEYRGENIAIALFLNMIIVYLVLRSTRQVELLLGEVGMKVLKKFFGLILLAIAIKLFRTNTGI
jgi:multiple antibiotic resistance protein